MAGPGTPADRSGRRPRRPCPTARRKRLAPGTLRPASSAQRAYLLDLIERDDRPEPALAEWLWTKYQIASAQTHAFDSRLAGRVIQALLRRAQGIAARRNADGGAR